MRAFFDYVAQRKKTMIMISHSRENLAFFDAIQILEKGKIRTVKNAL